MVGVALGQEMTQVPLAHRFPLPQACPQVPQLAPSLWRFTQVALEPVPHVFGIDDGQAQAPDEHCCPVVHLVPQAPQFVASLVRSTHEESSPLLQVTLGAQGSTHRPAMQVRLPVQVVPQVPQFFKSVFRLTQVPLQIDCVESSQERRGSAAQTLATQTMPDAQTVPQAPQLLASRVVSVQVALHDV